MKYVLMGMNTKSLPAVFFLDLRVFRPGPIPAFSHVVKLDNMIYVKMYSLLQSLEHERYSKIYLKGTASFTCEVQQGRNY